MAHSVHCKQFIGDDLLEVTELWWLQPTQKMKAYKYVQTAQIPIQTVEINMNIISCKEHISFKEIIQIFTSFAIKMLKFVASTNRTK